MISHHFCSSLSLFINRYMNSDKLFIIQAINIVTPSGIQTWIFSLQLCLNIVDNLSCSATTAGLQWKVSIETNIGTKFVVYYNHLVSWSKTCFFKFSNIFPLFGFILMQQGKKCVGKKRKKPFPKCWSTTGADPACQKTGKKSFS